MFIQAIAIAAVATPQTTPPTPARPAPHPVRLERRVREDAKVFKSEVQIPVVDSASPFANLANPRIRATLVAIESEFLAAAREYKTEFGIPTNPFSLVIRPTVSINHARVLSLLLDHYEFSGGAHPNSFTHVLNLAFVGGKPKIIGLADILKPGKDPAQFAQLFILPRVDAQRRRKVGEPVHEIPTDNYDQFIVSNYGLTFPFDAYTLGAYVEGTYQAKIPWAEMKGWINPAVIPLAR